MLNFPKTKSYLESINLNTADPLDKVTQELLYNESAYERASQALRRRFVRGAEIVEGVDRGGVKTKIKREKVGGKYRYYVMGQDGSWNTPDERIWVVSMYALWQKSKGV
jgi:hypothetical protein